MGHKYHANHAQTREMHCGLNESSLDHKKGEKSQESLGDPRKQRKTANGYNERT